MNFTYYPGCTLKAKGKDLDIYARKCAEVLGVTMDEIKDWQCCGGCYTTSQDEIATKLASVRALVEAKNNNTELLTLCSACHNVIKRVNNDMATNDYFNFRVNNYLKLDQPYNGEATVIHYLEMLRDKVGFDKIKEKVVNPLTGKKIGAYYGCLLLRPSSVMAFDNPENPTILEDFIKAIGATPVIYQMRNECCGAYCTLEDKAIPKKRSDKIIENALSKGAECLITACPLCLYNLKVNGGDKIPVYYFTELLAEALGVK
ncbi:MAG: CoB--CoM heterodisulfide reductase iron-sulfur subunit B family protein [Clostridia bacterium]|nr:CoB--CoM heterodisulfide reductase iron-sulfur subunit B family protein [Clostridia bacterium]